MKKAPNDIDRQVGARLRARRMALGMSQEKLGEGLGVTFQQVQKYERGTNRISASRLHQTADILGVSIDFLYGGSGGSGGAPGFAEGEGSAPYDAEILTGDGLKLLTAFRKVRDAQVRKRLLMLVTALSDADDGSATRSD